MSHFTVRLVGILLPLLALAAVPAAAYGQQEGTATELAESQQRLQEIRREREQLRAEMGRVRSQVHDLSGELSNLERQMAASEKLLHEIEFQIEGTQQRIQQTRADLAATQARLARQRAALDRRLRDIYKRGALHTPRVLLQAESFSDLLNRYKYLYLTARRDRAAVDEVTRLQEHLRYRENSLRQSLAEVQLLRAQRLQEHAELEALEEQRKRTLASLRSRERSTAQRIEQLERDERQLSSLIATLERRRREAERREAERAAAERRRAAAEGTRSPAAAPAPRAEASRLSTRDLGMLGWPVEGNLLYRFGRTVQPNGTAVRRNGVGIAAPAGTAVRAVEGGRVELAAPFEGYGPTVVLSHGGGYYSLYLYLREISVREGDEVSRGQAVGTVGGEHTPEGTHVEFQIRAPGGQAVDPLIWLRQRSR